SYRDVFASPRYAVDPASLRSRDDDSAAAPPAHAVSSASVRRSGAGREGPHLGAADEPRRPLHHSYRIRRCAEWRRFRRTVHRLPRKAQGEILLIALLAMLVLQQGPAVTAIRAGTLIDGTGGAPVKNAVTLVQGDRITAVGTNVPVPA